jgi:hypothetical protein
MFQYFEELLTEELLLFRLFVNRGRNSAGVLDRGPVFSQFIRLILNLYEENNFNGVFNCFTLTRYLVYICLRSASKNSFIPWSRIFNKIWFYKFRGVIV